MGFSILSENNLFYDIIGSRVSFGITNIKFYNVQFMQLAQFYYGSVKK